VWGLWEGDEGGWNTKGRRKGKGEGKRKIVKKERDKG